MEFELGELVAHRGVGPGQEARADAIGDLAEPQIEARRLDLVGLDLGRGRISPPAIMARMAWLGRMPVRAKALCWPRPGSRREACREAPRKVCRSGLRAPWSVFAFLLWSGHLKLGLLPRIHKRAAGTELGLLQRMLYRPICSRRSPPSSPAPPSTSDFAEQPATAPVSTTRRSCTEWKPVLHSAASPCRRTLARCSLHPRRRSPGGRPVSSPSSWRALDAWRPGPGRCLVLDADQQERCWRPIRPKPAREAARLSSNGSRLHAVRTRCSARAPSFRFLFALSAG